jgi:hypothetical protein
LAANCDRSSIFKLAEIHSSSLILLKKLSFTLDFGLCTHQFRDLGAGPFALGSGAGSLDLGSASRVFLLAGPTL